MDLFSADVIKFYDVDLLGDENTSCARLASGGFGKRLEILILIRSMPSPGKAKSFYKIFLLSLLRSIFSLLEASARGNL